MAWVRPAFPVVLGQYGLPRVERSTFGHLDWHVVIGIGLGGTLEALHHGVPMVCVPITGEQIANAQAVTALGAGQVVWRSRGRGAACRGVQEEPRRGGAVAAADAIEALVGK